MTYTPEDHERATGALQVTLARYMETARKLECTMDETRKAAKELRLLALGLQESPGAAAIHPQAFSTLLASLDEILRR